MKLAIILFFIPLTVFCQNAKEIAKKYMNSTVSLVLEDNYKQPLSLGSGFIVDDGIIVTNVHVVENATYGYVTISGENKKYNIEGYYAIDRTNDLILLSVPTLIGNPIEFNSNPVEIGERIYAIGNPKGLSGTISEGIISGVRTVGNSELIQITAPISPGSSGGPIINDNGKLIGVSVGTLKEGQNLNFAIPVKYVMDLISSNNNQLNNLNIKSINKKNNTSNTHKDIKEGLEIVNVEWRNDAIPEVGVPATTYTLEGFSIKNNLPYEITEVKLLLIIKTAKGVPIDAQEYKTSFSYREPIKPFLSKYIKSYGINDRIRERKPSDKLEIRILDFEIKE